MDIVSFGHFDDCYTRSFLFLFENRTIVVKCNKTRNIVRYIFLVRDPYNNNGLHELIVQTESHPNTACELLPKFRRYPIWSDSELVINIPTLISMLDIGVLLSLECFWENVTERHKTQFKDLNIEFKFIPHTQLLNELCEYLGRKSVLITVFCSAICSIIRTRCSGVVDARATYLIGKENDINFVVVTKKKCQIPTLHDRPIILRSLDDDNMSKEASYVVKNELEITKKQRKELRMILDKYTGSLLKRHTNITLISISSIKSRNFKTEGKHILEHKPCIVFYVHVKGFIPIDEDEIPSSIDGYPTDIREGAFTPYVLESCKVHDQVKMGCLIQGLQTNIDDSGNVLTGTLGGFIDHPDFGLCCFTSAHAMLSDNDMRAIGRGEALQPQTNVSCYQPCLPYRFGSLVSGVCKEGNDSCPGVEVVMIRVEDREIDDQGRFPGTDEIVFRSGEILESKEILQHIYNGDACVIKYGAETGVTKGSIHSDKTTFTCQHRNLPFTLRNQIEVIGDGTFAGPGDSGALVFQCSQNRSLKVIGVIEGGTSYKTYIVTPICAILKSLGMPYPLKMKVFDRASGEQSKLNDIERRISLLESSTDNLKSDVAEIKTHLIQQDGKLDTIISFLKGGQFNQTNNVSQ